MYKSKVILEKKKIFGAISKLDLTKNECQKVCTPANFVLIIRFMTFYYAFNTLGLRLYGSQWNGYEIWAYRVEDPTETLEAKNLLFAQIEKVGDQIQECGKERGDVIGKSD